MGFVGIAGSRFPQPLGYRRFNAPPLAPTRSRSRKRLLEWELYSEWETFYGAAETYADVLGDKGLAIYRRLAEEVWAKVPRITSRDERDRRHSNFHFKVTHMMEALARVTGDVDALVAVKANDLSYAYHYVQIVELYRDAGRVDDALEWAEKGLAAFPERTAELRCCLSNPEFGTGPRIWESWLDLIASREGVSMSRRHLLLVFSLTVIAAAVASLGAGSAIAAGGKTLTATLTGATEVPGPGDPDGAGTAEITINPGLKSVCYKLTWANLDDPVWGGHIHTGGAGTAGGVLVTLFGGPLLPRTSFPGTFTVSDCVNTSLSSAQLADIVDNPSGYYVNLHTDVFPDGAIRGQLSKPAED